MRRLSGVVALLLLAGCMNETPDPSDPQGRAPAQLGDQRANCEAAGGQLVESGLVGLTCVTPTSDAGQACTRDSDCEDLCLADAAPSDTGPADAAGLLDQLAADTQPPRTGSCAPQSPTFGCHSIFRDDGEIVEICID
jgi:hypothetical protein